MSVEVLEKEMMEETQVERRKMVTVPQEEFEAMLERAAERVPSVSAAIQKETQAIRM
jgi:predicted component of type VI protein secretion system